MIVFVKIGKKRPKIFCTNGITSVFLIEKSFFTCEGLDVCDVLCDF